MSILLLKTSTLRKHLNIIGQKGKRQNDCHNNNTNQKYCIQLWICVVIILKFLVNRINAHSVEFTVESTSNNKCISELFNFTFSLQCFTF